jgi:SAM-dependent methyltransferase
MVDLADKIQTNDFAETELVKLCPLCASDKEEFLFWNYDRLNQLPGKFALVQCEKCKLVRLSPRPVKESLPLYYPEDDYYSYQSPTASIDNVSAKGSVAQIRQNIRQVVFDYLGYPGRKLTLLEKTVQPLLVKLLFKQATYGWGKRFPLYKKDGFALDIGCGSGTFLSFLKHHGWRVQGVDLSRKAADVAKKAFDIDVFVGEIDELPFPPGTFDFINMSHVLEHVFDPLETIEKVRTLLKPDGVLYIEVPNYQSYGQKISKQYWYGWETPRHLYTFSPSNLKTLVQSGGFEVIDLNTKVENLFEWSNTYKHEEKEGLKSVRPFIPAKDKPELFFLRAMAKISHLFSRSNGEFICCWATPKK